jgi:ATP-binding cassette subfamily F protein uup
MDELAEITGRQKTATAQIDFTGSGRRTKALVETEQIAKELGGRTLFQGLDLKLSPDMRVGLVGPNGSGKTTLLRIIAGEIEPDSGAVRRADFLRTVYFDQRRERLEPEATLRKSLAPEGDSVMYRGRPLHVNAWAKRFLFPPDHMEMPVGRLSGGEQARVLIARVMLEAADVLLLDEPTNDLDIPTLETLEESLNEFPGALVLVTHDRYMLDRVSTMIVGLDGQGGAALFAEYAQWESWIAERTRAAKDPAKPAVRQQSMVLKKRLSYLESREWESMEERILGAEELLEERKSEVQTAAAAGDSVRLQAAYQALQAAQDEIDRLYARWADLEAKQA